MTEIVICPIPFGEPNEQEALQRAKDLGFTSVQIYTYWRTFEAAGRERFHWEILDRQVEAIRNAGLKYVPFFLMGPYYAVPDWWLESKGHVGLRCLEHDKPCPIESVWNPQFNDEIARVANAFAAHYLPWDAIESVQPGICGDYGEAIFPVLGNWPGTYHTHRGYWCGGDDAVRSFRAYLQEQYETLDALNARWRTAFASFDAISPRLPHRCGSRPEVFDLHAWYRKSMTDYAEVWMAACRSAFPETPIYLCTGGADDETTSGALFSQQAKVAAKYKGGIRLTNEGNTFAYNFPLTSHTHAACVYYGAYLGLEPVGPVTEQGVLARIFGSAAFGDRQIFHYLENMHLGEGDGASRAAEYARQFAPLTRQQPSEQGIAVFWPIDQATITGAVTSQSALGGDLSAALLHVRRQYPAAAVSEELILDGVLSKFRCLVMIGVASARSEVLECIAAWVQNDGGILLTTARACDIDLDPVAAFDALLGITPESEDASGHNDQALQLPDEFAGLGTIDGFHAMHGWLGLMPDVELLSAARAGIGSSGVESLTRIHPVSALYRRRFPSGGQAIYYGGAICFKSDPQALFRDPEVIRLLLDDICSLTNIRPLGTRDDEIARARIGGKLLVLREGGLDVYDDDAG